MKPSAVINRQAVADPAVDLEPDQAPDPRALAVAAALQEMLPDTRVLLFGSRARGGWRANSDIDLAVIGAERRTVDAACQQVYERVDGLYEDWCPDISTHTFTTAEFDALRTSLPHMAGQVQRYGLTPEGEHLPAMAQNNPWPGIQVRLKACQRHLIEALQQYGQGGKPITTLYYAQAALEVAVKARMFVAGLEPENKHGFEELLKDVSADVVGDLPSAQDLADLSVIRVRGMYADPDELMPTTSVSRLLASVQRTCARLEGETLTLMGKARRAVGYPEWQSDGPLGGVAALPLDYYSQAEHDARTRQEGHQEGRQEGREEGELEASVSALRVLLGNRLTDRQIDRVADDWRAHGLPADAMARVGEVMANPDTWRNLLGDEEERARDADQPPPREHSPPKGDR